MKTIELLAPAGNPEALDAAIGEGADAVYLGLKSFNARMRSSNFAFSQFEAAVEALHKAEKRIYVTVNTVFEEREADRVYQFLQYLSKVGPDAIIVQDLGVAKMVRDHFPSLRLHASTQMDVASAAGANGLSRLGFRRVVLSRELSLAEIAAIKASSNIELETFVHGALCMSYSGICLFSSYYGGKSANRGCCAQACRRLYQTQDASGYYFSPKDLQLLPFVPDLVESGVSSFKIEGRMKSAEYVGTVVAAYRYMIDHWDGDRLAAQKRAEAMLKNDFARAKTSYFIGSGTPDFLDPAQAGGTGIALGKVKELRAIDGLLYVLPEALKSGGRGNAADLPIIASGDSLRIHSSDDSDRTTTRVKGVHQGQEGIWLTLADEPKAGDSLYLVQTKAMSKRYRNVLPNNLDRYRLMPSRDKAPLPERRKLDRSVFEDLGEGLWAMTDKVADLFTFQADRPEKAVLRLSRQSAADLFKEGSAIPFKKDKLAIYLEPFFPESDYVWLEDCIARLVDSGVRHFFVNNLGHLALLRGKGLSLIAGDYLYAFNSFAADLLQEQGMPSLVPPLEISKQNLMRVAETANLQASFVTLFSFPALFRIKADLSRAYEFRFFSARAEEDFQLIASKDGSIVVPQKPVCWTDKREFLEKSGFKRFILDFSYSGLKKPLYKQVMDAAKTGGILPGTGRFNWKDGFWNPEEPGTGASGHAGRKDRAAPSEKAGGKAAGGARRSRSISGEGDSAPRGRKPSAGKGPASRSKKPLSPKAGAAKSRNGKAGAPKARPATSAHPKPRGGEGPKKGKPRRP